MMEVSPKVRHAAYLGGVSGFFEVLPGVNAQTVQYANMMWDLAELIAKNQVPPKIENGIYYGDDLSDFGSLVQMPGICATPLSQPESSLVSPVHENFVYTQELLSEYISKFVEFSVVRLNNTSTIGFPQLTNDREAKLALARELLKIPDVYLKAMSDAALGRRSHFSLIEYNAPIVYKIGRRLQSNDAIEILDFKQRTVRVKSRRVLHRGKYIYQDRLFMFKNEIPLVAQRERLFQGMHNGPNTQTQFTNNGMYNGAKKAFPLVLVITKENLDTALANAVGFITSDMPRFDTNVVKELIRASVKSLPGINDQAIAAYESFLNCPVVSFRATQTRVEPVVYRGDDLSIDDKNQLWYGLASGASNTATVGKEVGINVGIWIAEAAAGNDFSQMSKEEVKQIFLENCDSLSKYGTLRYGNGTIHMRGAGDNLVFIPTDAKYLNIVTGYDKQKSGLPAQLDPKGIFAGFIAQKKGGKIVASYRIMNYLTRLFQPETDIHRADRRLFRLGFRMRQELYKDSESYKMVNELIDYVLRKHYDINLHGHIMRIGEREKAILGLKMTQMNFDKVVEFLDDPSKVLWKFDEDSIPEELLNEYYTPIYPEEYAHLIKVWTN